MVGKRVGSTSTKVGVKVTSGIHGVEVGVFVRLIETIGVDEAEDRSGIDVGTDGEMAGLVAATFGAIVTEELEVIGVGSEAKTIGESSNGTGAPFLQAVIRSIKKKSGKPSFCSINPPKKSYGLYPHLHTLTELHNPVKVCPCVELTSPPSKPIPSPNEKTW
jgi:hypothetical protein